MANGPPTYETKNAVRCKSFERARRYLFDRVAGRAVTHADMVFAWRCREASPAFAAADCLSRSLRVLDETGYESDSFNSLKASMLAHIGMLHKEFEGGL